MGLTTTYTCTRCGKSIDVVLGVGMMYPNLCKRVKEDARSGKLGKKLQKVVMQHPEGHMDCETIVYVCDCGAWKTAARNDYYIVHNQAFDEDDNYSSWTEIGGTVLYETKHLCPKCRRKMHPLPEEKLEQLTCPDCGGKLKSPDRIVLWD